MKADFSKAERGKFFKPGAKLRLPICLAVAVGSTPVWGQGSSFPHLLFAAPIAVSGTAVDSAGNPVQGVRVEHLAVRDRIGVLVHPPVETDANGRFRFETLAPSAVFRKDGFDSQLVRLSNSQSELRVVLHGAPPKDEIPVLRRAHGCVALDGVLCLAKVKGVSIGDARVDIDAFSRSFTVRQGQMIHGSGPSWGGPNPRDEEVWSSVEYQERIRDGNGIRVIDARGRTLDDKLWRSVGVRGESAFYFDLDAALAALMDRVLDGVSIIRK